jgi:AcrR family transcriptional regulator
MYHGEAMNAMELIHRVTAAWHQPPSEDTTAQRVLEAAARQLELFGIQRTTMEDVARRAGVSRVTIYRHFATKDVLVEAVVLQEVRSFLDELRAFVEDQTTDEERIIEGFAFTATRLRDHTLLRRLLEGEPELFLPQLTTGAGPLVALARSLIVDYAARRMPHLPTEDVEVGAEVGVRLMISLILTPESVVDLDDPERLRALARRFLPYALLEPPRPSGRTPRRR